MGSNSSIFAPLFHSGSSCKGSATTTALLNLIVQRYCIPTLTKMGHSTNSGLQIAIILAWSGDVSQSSMSRHAHTNCNRLTSHTFPQLWATQCYLQSSSVQYGWIYFVARNVYSNLGSMQKMCLLIFLYALGEFGLAFFSDSLWIHFISNLRRSVVKNVFDGADWRIVDFTLITVWLTHLCVTTPPETMVFGLTKSCLVNG